ncbi:MAG: hypothetical protein ACW97A_08960 [Candidatus Thorarchaeota archaeon]
MRKRENIIWYAVFGVSVIVAIYLVFAFLGMEDTSMLVEIVGASIGFMLAISFAEVAKLDDKKDREKRLISSFLSEIIVVIEYLKRDSMWLPSDMWDMGIGSGDICLLDNITRNEFSIFFSTVKSHRDNAEGLRAARISQDAVLIPKFIEVMDDNAKLMHQMGQELLAKYS